MADIKIAGRIKAGAADGISGYASEILFDDAASNKTVKEKIEEAASSPQTMIVTITPDGNDGYEAGKTFAEIKAFIDNGGTVIAKDEEDGDSYYYLDNYIASEVVFTRNIWGSGGFSTRYYTIDNTNTVSFIDSVHHISSAVNSSSTADLANSAAVKALRDSMSEIKSISVNNTEQQVDQEGNVDIAVPTSLADLAGDSTHRVVTDAEKSTWNGKQNALTFDNVPTANSNNPVKSGGVYQAIQSIDVSDQISDKADKSEMSVVAGTGANADKTTITLKSGTSATVLTQHQDISGKEDKSNKVTSFSSPTDTQYPSAKLVNDQLATKQGTISDLSTIRSGASAGATAVQSVTVGTTTTGAAGTNASVTNTGTATEPVLSFTIPQGVQGIQGIQGPQGERGPQGNTGVQVDSVASIIHSIDPTATYAAADVAGADAVQDVLSEVTELAGKMKEEVAYYPLTDSSSQKGYLNKNAAFVSSDSFVTTDYIDVSALNEDCTFNLYMSAGQYTTFLYDSNKTFIARILNATTLTEYTYSEILSAIQSAEASYHKTAAYVRFSVNSGSTIILSSSDWLVNTLLQKFTEIDNRFNALNLDTTVGFDYFSSDAGYIGTTGAFTANEGFRTTAYIPIENTLISLTGFLHSQVANVTYWQFSGGTYTFLGYTKITSASASTKATITNFTIPDNTTHYRISYVKSQPSTDAVIKSSVIDVMKSDIEKANYATDYIALFDKIIFIGDSVTEGGCYNSAGTSKVSTMLSYPHRLNNLYPAITMYNLGVNGISSSGWLQKYNNGDFNDIPFSSTLLFIIELGWNGGLTGSVPAEGASPDTSTLCGAYCKIIENIQTVSPNAYIILVQSAGWAAKGADAGGSRIQKVIDAAARYNCGYINLDAGTYFTLIPDSSDNVHFTSYGYLRKAMYMKYAINDVIKANESVINDKIWSGA